MSRTTADAFLDTARLTLIDTRQQTLVGGRGRYYQCLRSHTVLPSTVDLVPNNLTAATADFGEGWSNFGVAIAGAWPCAIEIHVYDGPRGKGYDVVASLVEGATTFVRRISSGPEAADRSTGWL